MTLDKFLEQHGSKMRHLETLFLCDVFFNDYGEKGLDLIEPEVNIPRNDGTDRTYRIDFVIITKNNKYAVECNGFNYHAAGMVSKERFNELQDKSNEIRRQGFEFINLSRDQIEVTPDEGIYQLRRDFIADEELYSIFLNRNEGQISPHPVQEMALEKLAETREGGHKKGLVVLATGLGKTYLGILDTIQTKAVKVLYIVHVGEVLKKSRNSFEKVVPNRIEEMGNFTGGDKDKTKNILFATIQTLTRDQNLHEFDPEAFDYIILDETHHLAAPSYKKVFEYFQPKFFLGLTATPERLDQQDILPFYENNLVFEMGQDEAIKKGYLTGLLYRGFKDNVDYSNIFFNGSKYDVIDLNKSLMIEKRDKAIIDKYLELAPNKKTIGFCVSIEHADWCTARFKEAGISAVSIHSKLDRPDVDIDLRGRDKAIRDFEEGKYQIAFVVNMFNEGVDFPDVECVLLLRPTESTTILTQQIGRGLRINPGKKHVLVLDFIGNYQTAYRILPALGIHDVGELKEDKEKGVFYYDNDGRNVVLESEVVQILKLMQSRATKKARTDLLDEEWIEYGEYLKENTSPSYNLFWKVGKKNDHLGVHMWALNYLKSSTGGKSADELSREIRDESRKLFPGKTMEGTRALFFSKLLGIADTSTPLQTTPVFKEMNEEFLKNNDIADCIPHISRQLEKFCFWNDIFSLTDRHTDREERKPINEYFHIYPLFYIYETLLKLKSEYGYDHLELTKFEVDNFLSLSRTHNDINQTVEKIVKYREDEEKYEIEKYLNEMSTMDSRFFKVLRYSQYFTYNPEFIKLKPEYINEIEEKTQKFNMLLEKNQLITFDEQDPEAYRKMLYSTKSLLDYHDKN